MATATITSDDAGYARLRAAVLDRMLEVDCSIWGQTYVALRHERVTAAAAQRALRCMELTSCGYTAVEVGRRVGISRASVERDLGLVRRAVRSDEGDAALWWDA
jgi:hypothetical protein